MKAFKKRARRGFSLVELLAVVLILAVLAAVAVPLYINTRKTSAARSCLGNLAAIMSAESAYALRKGNYTTSLGDLTNAVEGFAQSPRCPLNGGVYTMAVSNGALTITCPNNGEHIAVIPSGAWVKTMNAPAVDNDAVP